MCGRATRGDLGRRGHRKNSDAVTRAQQILDRGGLAWIDDQLAGVTSNQPRTGRRHLLDDDSQGPLIRSLSITSSPVTEREQTDDRLREQKGEGVTHDRQHRH